MTKMVSVAGELAFLLGDNPETEAVTPQMVLHAVAHKFTERTQYMPAGMTYADSWMARYGDPLASTEAALKMASTVDRIDTLTATVDAMMSKATVRIYYHGGPMPVAVDAPSLPLAITIAALNHAAAKESTS